MTENNFKFCIERYDVDYPYQVIIKNDWFEQVVGWIQEDEKDELKEFIKKIKNIKNDEQVDFIICYDGAWETWLTVKNNIFYVRSADSLTSFDFKTKMTDDILKEFEMFLEKLST